MCAENRCVTGIPGFDELCQGGFVKGSVNALLGGPGAGKTTFLLQYLYNGVMKFNENGLYLSFEPDVSDIFLDAFTFGWDLQSLDSKGKIKFVKISPKITLKAFKDEIMKLVSQNDARRICIDPISVLSLNLERESRIRSYIFDLASLLKRLNATIIMADETVEGNVENFGTGFEDVRTRSVKYLSDGLVNLYSSGLGGESDRAIRIAKMRRTNHVRGPVPFEINNRGISIKKRKL
ncbi:hypothetical protein GF386_00980 [Candidatus Pacearchaeota archaeon]|nr:hypothetical protein [Candidatus Pacearchaeota archaeon]MBD3282809.1 hypothetical protein [Candidatus Pacearchaeota archaeon]